MSTPTEKIAYLKTCRELFKDNTAQAQRKRILAALERYSITTYEAREHLDVYYPPARICELRVDDHKIQTHWITVLTGNGGKHRVGLYVMNSFAGAGGLSLSSQGG